MRVSFFPLWIVFCACIAPAASCLGNRPPHGLRQPRQLEITDEEALQRASPGDGPHFDSAPLAGECQGSTGGGSWRPTWRDGRGASALRRFRFATTGHPG